MNDFIAFAFTDPKIPGGTHSNNNKKVEPFINVTVANKLAAKLFHGIIDKYKYTKLIPMDINGKN